MNISAPSRRGSQRSMRATGVEMRWDVEEIGLRAFDRTGEVLPSRAVSSIRENGVGLKGPIQTPEGAGIRSANLVLRKELMTNRVPDVPGGGKRSGTT